MAQRKNEYSLQIYFSAPSFRTEEEKEQLLVIRQAIVNSGCTFTYDWLQDKEKLSAKKLYEKAINGINRADLVIAEVTSSSTGVGQQIAYAVENKIPVLALKNQDIEEVDNRFTLGSENTLFKIVEYSRSNLPKTLKFALSEYGKGRFEKFNFISTPDINTYLTEKGSKMGVSKSQLLRQIIKSYIADDKMKVTNH